MADQLYINRPGGVIAPLKDGTREHLTYGQPVPDNVDTSLFNVSDFADAQQRGWAATQEQEAHRRAALAEGGQVNSSSSPVPGNYADLDEDGAAQFVANLSRYPAEQAAVVKHEILFGGGRQKVLDAASAGARQDAELQIGALTEAESDLSGDVSGAPVTGSGDPTKGGISRDDAARAQEIQAKFRQNLPEQTGEEVDGGDAGEVTFDSATSAQLNAYAEQHKLGPDEGYKKGDTVDDRRAVLKQLHGEPQTPLE